MGKEEVVGNGNGYSQFPLSQYEQNGILKFPLGTKGSFLWSAVVLEVKPDTVLWGTRFKLQWGRSNTSISGDAGYL